MSVFESLLLAMLLPWRCACYFLFAILLRINNNTLVARRSAGAYTPPAAACP
jgi:hypothetical protein